MVEAGVTRIDKPWGYELWLNGQHPGYAFKMLFLKRGSKTSLQYHRHKQETNVIYSGTALLHYKNNEDIDNDDDVDDSDKYLHKRRKAIHKATKKESAQ